MVASHISCFIFHPWKRRAYRALGVPQVYDQLAVGALFAYSRSHCHLRRKAVHLLTLPSYFDFILETRHSQGVEF